MTSAPVATTNLSLCLSHDLHGLRVLALGFETVRIGGAPYVIALAIDDDGDRHWIGMRPGTPSVATSARLCTELVRRGLRLRKTGLVFVAGCEEVPETIRVLLDGVAE